MGLRGSPDHPGDTHDANSSQQLKGVAAHVASSLLGGLTSGNGTAGGQFPFVDPNVLMMTNAAATIAAVAASAVQQMTQGKQHHGVAGGGNSPVPPGLAGAFAGSAGRALLTSHATSRAPGSGNNGQLSHQQVAALMGGGGGQSSLGFQLSSPPSSHTGSSSRAGISSSQNSFPTPSSGSMSSVLLPGMQTWTLEQIEQHVSLLHQMNQPVPQSVALLLADARRKEDKRTAKRVANRKSACTSRARKKALVEEMTKTNARLRRQAMILALLPDLVIAITTEGEITFCSAQVERVLRYKIDDLVGAKLHDLLVPASRGALATLITELVAMEKRHLARDAQTDQQRSKRRRSDEQNVGEAAEGDSKGTEENENRNADGNDSGRGSSRLVGRSVANSSAAAVVSEQSFPPTVVEVESKRSAANETAVNSDASSSHDAGKPKAVSSLTTSTNVSRSPTDSFSGEDDGARRSNPDEPASSSKVAKRLPSSDDSSSLSSEAKNMRNANENLDRNVRWHNQRMLGDTSTTKTRYHGPKDDVTGQSVTKNNATARLSSLKHVPEQSKRRAEKSSRYESNGDQSSSDDSLLAGVEEKKKGENNSDDSGYRESNESREETSSSGSETSNSNGHRKKLMAPTCKVCLIRDDLTTVWCEVTSSIRTRSVEEESPFDALTAELTGTAPPEPSVKSTSDAPPGALKEAAKEETVTELLLCLRPIRDGEKKVAESLRFKREMEEGDQLFQQNSSDGAEFRAAVSSSSGGPQNSSENASSNRSRDPAKRPPKKRPHQAQEAADSDGSADEEQEVMDASPTKKKRNVKQEGAQTPVNASDDTEKSVVESLMLMSNKSQ